MSERAVAFRISSDTSSIYHYFMDALQVDIIDGIAVYNLRQTLMNQINGIAGSDWTYQFSLSYYNVQPTNSINETLRVVEDGIILHFRNPDHALLFKLSSSFHLEVIP